MDQLPRTAYKASYADTWMSTTHAHQSLDPEVSCLPTNRLPLSLNLFSGTTSSPFGTPVLSFTVPRLRAMQMCVRSTFIKSKNCSQVKQFLAKFRGFSVNTFSTRVDTHQQKSPRMLCISCSFFLCSLFVNNIFSHPRSQHFWHHNRSICLLIIF